MTERDYEVRFNKNGCKLLDMNQNMRMIATNKKEGRMFKFDALSSHKSAEAYALHNAKILDIEMWHKRVAHMNYQRLKNLPQSGLVLGISILQNAPPKCICKACEFGKSSRRPFSHEGIRSRRSLELIHSDLWTPSVPTLNGHKYYVSFVDDYSCKTWLYVMKEKFEAFQQFQEFKAMVEKQTRISIFIL